MDDSSDRFIAAPLVAVAGFVVPGLGYALVGEKKRGLISGLTILLLYLGGMLIGGVRVIDVPGYDSAGQRKMIRVVRERSEYELWSLTASPTGEIMNKPWYIAQTLIGPANVVATWGSLKAADLGHRQSTARIFDIGTLYTAVAGMLNLLIVIDAAYRSTLPRVVSPSESST